MKTEDYLILAACLAGPLLLFVAPENLLAKLLSASVAIVCISVLYGWLYWNSGGVRERVRVLKEMFWIK